MFRSCFENCIIWNGQNYKCSLCDISYTYFVLMESHINTEEHRKKLEEAIQNRGIESNILSTFSENKFRKIVNNYIAYNDKQAYLNFFCHWCKVKICGIPNIFEHIKGFRHQSFMETEFIKSERSKKYQHTDTIIYSALSIPQHIDGRLHQVAINENFRHTENSHELKEVHTSNENFVDINYCKFCKVFLKNNRELQCHIMVHVYKSLNTDLKTDIIKVRELKNGKITIKCLLCNIFLTDYQELSEHLVQTLHLNRLDLFKNVNFKIELENTEIIQVNDTNLKKCTSEINGNTCIAYYCTVCNVSILAKISCNDHLLGKKHKTNLNEFKSETKLKSASEIVTNDSHYYLCFICQLDFSYLSELFLHFKSSQHRCKMICFLKIIKSSHMDFLMLSNKCILKCYLCQVSVCNCDNAIQHLLGKKHCSRSNELTAKIGTNANEKSSSTILESKAVNDSNSEQKPLIPKLNHFSGFQEAPNFEGLIKNLDNVENEKSDSFKIDFENLVNNCIARSKYSNFYTCYACNYEMPSSRPEIVDLHLKQNINHSSNNLASIINLNKFHVSKLSPLEENIYKKLVENSIVLKKKTYFCNFCNKNLKDLPEVKSHLNNYEHNAQLFAISNSDKFFLKNMSIQKNIKQLISCTKSELDEKSHLQKNKIEKKVENVTKELKLQNDHSKSSDKTVFKVKKFVRLPSLNETKNTKEFHTNPEELMKLGFSAETLKSLDCTKPTNVDDVLNDLICLKLDDKQKKLLPISAREKKPRIPTVDGQKNSFNRNALIDGKSYVEYCIEPGKNNIYNVDGEKIRLMKLGVALTFPCQSEQICIPCGHQLPDKSNILFEHLQDQEHVNNVIKLECDDKRFDNFPNQFSDLKLAKFFMQEESDDWVHCYLCDTQVPNDNKDILLHTKTSNHISKSERWKKRSSVISVELSFILNNIWYYAQQFICEVCKVRCNYEFDFIIHLKNSSHFENVKRLKFSENDLTFDCCHTCTIFWYGKSDYYNKHCQDNFHKRFQKNGDFSIPKMTVTAIDFLKDIDKKIDILINESDKAQLQKFKESYLLRDIKETVESKYSEAQAYTFGSRISYLGFPDSDIDVFLDCDNLYYKSVTKKKSEEYLTETQQLFENNPDIWYVEESLRDSRVPILKMRHIPTGLKCDISFMNGLGVEKSSLIGFYNAAYPNCRKMILYLKKWLNLCQLSGSDCITTFAISWYLIFYLQVKGILPTVHDLIKTKNKSKIVDGWECGFQEQFSVKTSDALLKNLHGFFNYYADFDYKTCVACPFLGKVIKKRTFAYPHELPKEMDSYKLSLKNSDAEIFRIDSPMCIQDPIDLSQNMTKAVKKLKLRQFIKYCAESAEKVLLQIV